MHLPLNGMHVKPTGQFSILPWRMELRSWSFISKYLDPAYHLPISLLLILSVFLQTSFKYPLFSSSYNWPLGVPVQTCGLKCTGLLFSFYHEQTWKYFSRVIHVHVWGMRRTFKTHRRPEDNHVECVLSPRFPSVSRNESGHHT